MLGVFSLQVTHDPCPSCPARNPLLRYRPITQLSGSYSRTHADGSIYLPVAPAAFRATLRAHQWINMSTYNAVAWLALTPVAVVTIIVVVIVISSFRLVYRSIDVFLLSLLLGLLLNVMILIVVQAVVYLDDNTWSQPLCKFYILAAVALRFAGLFTAVTFSLDRVLILRLPGKYSYRGTVTVIAIAWLVWLAALFLGIIPIAGWSEVHFQQWDADSYVCTYLPYEINRQLGIFFIVVEFAALFISFCCLLDVCMHMRYFTTHSMFTPRPSGDPVTNGPSSFVPGARAGRTSQVPATATATEQGNPATDWAFSAKGAVDFASAYDNCKLVCIIVGIIFFCNQIPFTVICINGIIQLNLDDDTSRKGVLWCLMIEALVVPHCLWLFNVRYRTGFRRLADCLRGRDTLYFEDSDRHSSLQLEVYEKRSVGSQANSLARPNHVSVPPVEARAARRKHHQTQHHNHHLYSPARHRPHQVHHHAKRQRSSSEPNLANRLILARRQNEASFSANGLPYRARSLDSHLNDEANEATSPPVSHRNNVFFVTTLDIRKGGSVRVRPTHGGTDADNDHRHKAEVYSDIPPHNTPSPKHALRHEFRRVNLDDSLDGGYVNRAFSEATIESLSSRSTSVRNDLDHVAFGSQSVQDSLSRDLPGITTVNPIVPRPVENSYHQISRGTTSPDLGLANHFGNTIDLDSENSDDEQGDLGRTFNPDPRSDKLDSRSRLSGSQTTSLSKNSDVTTGSHPDPREERLPAMDEVTITNDSLYIDTYSRKHQPHGQTSPFSTFGKNEPPHYPRGPGRADEDDSEDYSYPNPQETASQPANLNSNNNALSSTRVNLLQSQNQGEKQRQKSDDFKVEIDIDKSYYSNPHGSPPSDTNYRSPRSAPGVDPGGKRPGNHYHFEDADHISEITARRFLSEEKVNDLESDLSSRGRGRVLGLYPSRDISPASSQRSESPYAPDSRSYSPVYI